jgi:outer membrane protein
MSGGLLVWALCASGLSFGGEAPASLAVTNLPRAGLIEVVRVTLKRDPNIQIQEFQVDVAKGVAQSAAGAFDTTLETSLSHDLTHTPLTESDRYRTSGVAGVVAAMQDTSTYRLGFSKLLRTGPTVGTGIELSRFTDNLYQESAANLARVNFTLKLPLLRGLGREAVEANERAAKINHEAAILDLRHAVATRLMAAVAAYWTCHAAEQEAAVLRDFEGHAEELARHLRRLSSAGEFPKGEVEQAEADYAEKTAARIRAEQLLLDARQNLGLAMGLGADELAATPLPGEPFPQPPPNPVVPVFTGDALVAQSLNRRADYQSALKAERANQALLAGARNNIKPQLDLNLAVGYTGLSEGSEFRHYYTSLYPWDAPGPNVAALLRLEWPMANRTAQGLLLQRQAKYEQSLLQSQNLGRSISATIQVALSELGHSIQELRKLDESVDRYQRALTNETQKLRLGTSTVIDHITIADRFSAVLQARIAVLARYASALVRVRYETGLLLPPGPTSNLSLTREGLLTLPRLAESPGAPAN